MKNAAYWQNRFTAIEQMNNNRARKAVQATIPSFDRAEAEIQKQIDTWYARFANNNQISLQEAQIVLNARELKELKWDIDDFIKYGRENAIDPKWMKELENASARYHISRLEALKIRTQQAAEVAFGNETDVIDDLLGKTFTEGYYHTAYEIQKGIGIGWDIGQIDQSKLNKLLKTPWTSDRNTFSDRIWKSKAQLIDTVDKELTRMCILGGKPDDAIRNISHAMQVSKSQAGRLVMTESAFFASEAQKDCFEDLDVEMYEILATLDSRTSDICQMMDGKTFPMKDYQAGVTAPPFHPWCRSTTIPYFDDEWGREGTRAARGEDGKTYQVPATMTYEDWKKGFVDGGSKTELDLITPKGDVVEVKTIEDLKESRKSLREEIMTRQAWVENTTHEIINAQNALTEYDEAVRRHGDLITMSDKDFKKVKADAESQRKSLEDEIKAASSQRKALWSEPWVDPPDDIKPEYERLGNLITNKRSELFSVESHERNIKDAAKYRRKFKGQDRNDLEQVLQDLKDQREDLKKTIEDLYDQLDEVESKINEIEKGSPETLRSKIKKIKEEIAAKGGSIDEADLKKAGQALMEDLKGSDRFLEIDALETQMNEKYSLYESFAKKYQEMIANDPELEKIINSYGLFKRIEEQTGNLSPRQQEMFDSLKEKYKQIDRRIIDAYDKKESAYSEWYDAKKKLEELNSVSSNAENLKFSLSKVREMGIGDVDIDKHLKYSKSEAVGYVKQAYSYYPTDWVKASAAKNSMSVKKVDRGCYAWTEIKISGSGESAVETSIHELGHRMEDVFKSILDAEKEFYKRRTAGEDLKWLGSPYRRDEKTRKDNFLHPYMGKDYGGYAYELVSMGFEDAFGHPEILMKDPDMCEWIFGILSLLG